MIDQQQKQNQIFDVVLSFGKYSAKLIKIFPQNIEELANEKDIEFHFKQRQNQNYSQIKIQSPKNPNNFDVIKFVQNEPVFWHETENESVIIAKQLDSDENDVFLGILINIKNNKVFKQNLNKIRKYLQEYSQITVNSDLPQEFDDIFRQLKDGKNRQIQQLLRDLNSQSQFEYKERTSYSRQSLSNQNSLSNSKGNSKGNSQNQVGRGKKYSDEEEKKRKKRKKEKRRQKESYYELFDQDQTWDGEQPQQNKKKSKKSGIDQFLQKFDDFSQTKKAIVVFGSLAVLIAVVGGIYFAFFGKSEGGKQDNEGVLGKITGFFKGLVGGKKQKPPQEKKDPTQDQTRDQFEKQKQDNQKSQDDEQL